MKLQYNMTEADIERELGPFVEWMSKKLEACGIGTSLDTYRKRQEEAEQIEKMLTSACRATRSTLKKHEPGDPIRIPLILSLGAIGDIGSDMNALTKIVRDDCPPAEISAALQSIITIAKRHSSRLGSESQAVKDACHTAATGGPIPGLFMPGSDSEYYDGDDSDDDVEDDVEDDDEDDDGQEDDPGHYLNERRPPPPYAEEEEVEELEDTTGWEKVPASVLRGNVAKGGRDAGAHGIPRSIPKAFGGEDDEDDDKEDIY